MPKTQVYSWRVSPELLTALEREATRDAVSVSVLLDGIAEQWLQQRRRERLDDDDEQERLRAVAAETFGALSGGDPRRSERVRETVRAKLRARFGRSTAAEAPTAARSRRTG